MSGFSPVIRPHFCELYIILLFLSAGRTIHKRDMKRPFVPGPFMSLLFHLYFRLYRPLLRRSEIRRASFYKPARDRHVRRHFLPLKKLHHIIDRNIAELFCRIVNGRQFRFAADGIL